MLELSRVGDSVIVYVLRNLVWESAPMILCVVETQIAKCHMEGLVGTLGFDGTYGVGSSGHNGGLCIYWNRSFDLKLRKKILQNIT